MSYQRVICRTLLLNAIELALKFDIAPKTFRRYIDNSHARFGSRSNDNEFLNVFNSQDPQIQYTIGCENKHKELNFLDVTIKNNSNQSYDFAVNRKSTITNVQIKPRSNICPDIATGVFKEFLSRALHICSENYLAQEIDFLFKKRHIFKSCNINLKPERFRKSKFTLSKVKSE